LPETIYDVAIIGSGPAGYTAAIRAGQYGLKTALIEKDGFLGGTCLHVGCIPTKALLFNAELWDHLKEAKEFGIEGVDARKLNWAAIQDRKNKIVAKHTKGLEFLMKKNKVETIKGYGTLIGPAQDGIHTVELSGDGKSSNLKAKNVILATGSEARLIPGMEVSDRVLTNIEILSLKEIPKSLVIVGAGAVGVEFASIYRSFDCEVTIVEMLPRLVPVEDEEVSKELARVYRKRGINFHTSAKVDKVEKTKTGVSVTITVDGKQQKIEAEKILIAIGRKGDLTSKVRESLVSIGRVVTFVAAAVDGVKWSKDMREQLKTMQRDVISLTDHASYLSNKITFVLDAMLGVVNLEQNNIIKLFSVMAVVLMPPTLIASIYGMNFKDMPELEWAHGYPFALIAMVAAAVVPYYIFKIKKWL